MHGGRRSLPCISFHLNAAHRPARFALACPESQRIRFLSANRRPENPEKGARRPARFAYACPQSQRTRFSSANRRPENPEKGAYRPARFAHACPQSQRTRFSSANRRPENPEKGARRPSVHLFSSERGSGAGTVRARLPAKSMNSVFEREPWT